MLVVLADPSGMKKAPWCTMKGSSVMSVVSCPPLIEAVPVKAAIGLPTSAP